MTDYPTLVLAQQIVDAYLKDDFKCIIIYGNPRIGKSALAIKGMSQAIKFLKGKTITKDNLRHYMGWDTNEVVDEWLSIDKKQPCYTWDDAGYWLHSTKWNDPLLVSIAQYFNLIGTDYASLIMTTPDPSWILQKITKLPDVYRVKVIKSKGGFRDDDTTRFARRSICYKPYRSPDLKKNGVNKIWVDDYSCKIPDDIYEFYKPLRESYNKMAKENIRDQLKNKFRKEEITDLRYQANREKLENIIDREKKKTLKRIEVTLMPEEIMHGK